MATPTTPMLRPERLQLLLQPTMRPGEQRRAMAMLRILMLQTRSLSLHQLAARGLGPALAPVAGTR